LLIERCASARHAGWLELRDALCPQPRDVHLEEMAGIAAEAQRYAAFVAYTSERQPAAFAEAALRRDYVNGAQSSPVVFLEGLYVAGRARSAVPRSPRTRCWKTA
jgi:aminoglycoside 6'-N-acetyltransferase I